MAKIEDRYRQFVVDGAPLVTGVLALGDSWACTNPSVGRGSSIALMHSVALRDTLREVGVADPYALAVRWHEVSEQQIGPFVQDTLSFDRHRLAEIEAKLALAEDLLETLNRTIYRQQQHIDRLERELRALRDQVEAASAAVEPSVSGNEIPPHY